MCRFTTGGARPFGAAIARGEFVLLTAAMCGGACGVWLGAGATLQIYTMISGGAALIMLLCSSLSCADVSARSRAGIPVHVSRVQQTSLVVWLAGVGCSGAGVTCGGAACISRSWPPAVRWLRPSWSLCASIAPRCDHELSPTQGHQGYAYGVPLPFPAEERVQVRRHNLPGALPIP